MSLDMNLVAQQLDQIVADSSEMARAHYDMFFNPAPQDVSVKRYVNGALTTVTMPNRAKVQTWYAETIKQSINLRVPQDYPTLSAAMAWVNERRIAPGVLVGILLADGDHVLAGTLTLSHPDGERIHILGVSGNTLACRILPPASQGALMLEHGARLGMLDKVSLVGSGETGLGLTGAATCRIGHVRISGFGIACAAVEQSVLRGDTLTVEASSMGLYLESGSVAALRRLEGSAGAGAGGYAANGSVLAAATVAMSGSAAGSAARALYGSAIFGQVVEATGYDVAVRAEFGSQIQFNRGDTAGCAVQSSPVNDTVGNYNSYVFIVPA